MPRRGSLNLSHPLWSVMKQPVITLTSALLLFFAGNSQAQSFFSTLESVDTRSEVSLSTTQTNNTFGMPRASDIGSTTRVVFDLASGAKYSLTPTYLGLQLNIQNARVLPGNISQMGNSVAEYRTFDNMVFLRTPFSLGTKAGWKASETTLVTGAKVLILEIGPTVSGGPSLALTSNVPV